MIAVVGKTDDTIADGSCLWWDCCNSSRDLCQFYRKQAELKVPTERGTLNLVKFSLDSTFNVLIVERRQFLKITLGENLRAR
jgi:hypothetical protein